MKKRCVIRRLLASGVAVVLAFSLTGCSVPEKRFADALYNEQIVVDDGTIYITEDVENVRYQDDFYEYINEEILEEVELGPTDAQWSWFGELDAVVSYDMKQMIRRLVNSKQEYPKGSSEQKIRDMYECISNIENRNQTGLGPLQPYLDMIREAENIDEYVEALACLSGQFGFSSIVGGYYVSQDKEDSDRNAVYLMYADTLIGKEYLESPQLQPYVSMYYQYMVDMLMEFGMSKEEAVTVQGQIDVLLRDICASTLSAEEYYSPELTYNVFTKEELQDLYTNIDIDEMLKLLRIDMVDTYVVIDVEQAKKINSLLVEENLQVLKDFSTFVMLNDVAEYSTEGYAKLYDNMTNMMYGISESVSDEDSWMYLTQDLLPWDFGKIYVEQYYEEESRQQIETMIAEIIEVYKDMILEQSWMSDETKKKAIRKLETMCVKIGYPDEWPDSMEMMQVTPISEGGSLLSNLLVNMQVSIEDTLASILGEADREEWGMTPQTLNAYYNPSNNEIVFPAAILQSPFFDVDADYAQNLGGIGFVIAHEISHAFDSNGAQYDEYGNYASWWSEEEYQRYLELAQEIVEYYECYEVIGEPVDGVLTLSENIADLGAMACITKILEGDTAALSDAFIQFAYIWASEETVEYQMYLLGSDTHAPNKVRVNAALSACDAFYEVYDIAETDGMYVAPEDRVGIWK
ncbi:MAG: M13 family metallopeptidase [Lachnospiraceae bacterium]|nr:M13 family metallopeptidase [Lachnospiraceae bacterium]